MRLLVTGAGGQVGQHLRALVKDTDVRFALREELDICDRDALADALADRELIINLAAYTAVDRAESAAAAAFQVNETGAALIAQACAVRGLPLIHLSTDYVFDGRKGAPYVEDDEIAPVNVYGASKAAGEVAIRARHERHIILRTSWIVSARGTNFLRSIHRRALDEGRLRVVSDQWGGPTPAGLLAVEILRIAQTITSDSFEDWGTYHLGGAPRASWHELAQAYVQHLEAPVALEAIATSNYPTAAARPRDSFLDCAKITRAFAVHPVDWRAGLAEIARELLAESDGQKSKGQH